MPLWVGAGQLTEQVVIQQAAVSGDGQGGQGVTWGTLATVWANVAPWATQPDEALRAEAVTTSQRYRVETHYRADVTPQMRLSWTPYGGTAKTLEIYGVSPKDGRRMRLVLDCVEVPA